MPSSTIEFDPNSGWKVLTLSSLSGGLNTAKPDYLIEDSETPICSNVSMRGDRVRTDGGYVGIGAGTTLVGRPKGAFQHQDASGNSKILLVTDTRVYEYASTNDEWHYVSDGATGAVILNGGAGQGIGDTVINVDDATGFVIGRPVGVHQDDGTQHQALIVGVGAGAPGTVTIDVGLTVAAADAKTVTQGIVLTGNDDNQVVFAAVPSNEWTAFTNGVNYPLRYDGATVEVIPNLPSGGNVICKTLSLYKSGYLILGNLIEGGTDKPFKLIWCDAGDPTNWTTGDASYVNLMDSRDGVIAIKPLGDYIIVYRSRSIVRGEFLGLPIATFMWRTTVHGQSITSQGGGTISPNAVFALAGMHVFAGRSGIFGYDGGFGIEELSKSIYETIFSSDGEMVGDKSHRSFMSYMDKIGELYFFYCSKIDTFPMRAVVFNIREGKWSYRIFRREFAFAVDKQKGAGEEPRIMDLVGTIAEQAWVIGGSSVTGESPSILLGGIDQVYEYDYAATHEDGTNIIWFVYTKNFRMVDRYTRHAWIEVDHKGPALYVSAIKDDGAPVVLAVLASTGTMVRERIYTDFISRDVQYSFVGLGGGGEVGAVSMKYREEGYWSL